MTQYEELKNEIKELREEIKSLVTYFDTVEDCPSWAKPYVAKAVEIGYIKGDENGKLGLTETKMHTLVVELRAEGIME